MVSRRVAAVIPAVVFSAVLTFLLATPAGAQATFSDQTAAAGINHTTLMATNMAGQLHYPGAAIGDFNRDGWPDLFLLAGGGGSGKDKLYINNGDGTFTDEASSWGVDLIHRGRAVAAGDYDKDGWLDLFIASGGDLTGVDRGGQHILYHNNGNGTFTNVAAAAGVTTTSMTWLVTTSPAFGDYDLDGDLDLFVPTWVSPLDLNDGNRLFQNNGDGTFTDVTVAAGISQVNMHGFAGKFADMDGDRYPELMITSDFGTSRYYVNNTDGTFTDQTGPSGTGQDSNGMGHTVADFNGDGLLDWYVTSIYSDSTVDPQDGNHLYLNQGNHVYTDLPETFGAADGGVGWGAEALDCDNDGDLDIAETNGAPFGAEYIGERSYLYSNNGDETFTEVGGSAGISQNDDGKTLITFDYDRDGDMDIVITSYNAAVVLYRNDMSGPNTNWLEIFLDTSANPALAPDGCGSGITVTTGSVSQYRYLDCGPSYAGQSQNVAHYGLNSATNVDTITVQWADGTTTVLNDIAANQIMTLAAPSGNPAGPGEASKGDVPSDQMLAAYDAVSGDVDVTYTPSCEATNHTIYFGDLADVSTYGYSGAACFVGNTGSTTFDPGLDNAFFLIVGNDGAVEGPYGVDGDGFDRPEDTGTTGCDLPQDLAGACDLP